MTNPGADAFTLSRQFIAPTNVPALASSTQDWSVGELLTWDATSLANTVLLGGAVLLTNVPVCNPSGLTTGEVLLAKVPGGYIIMGNFGSARSVSFIDPIRYRSLRSDVPSTTTAMADAGVLNFLLAPGTQYGIDGALYYNAPGASHIKFAWTGPPNMACKWNTFGDVSTGTDDFPIFTVATAYGDATTQTIFGFGAPAVARPSAWFSTTDTGGILQLRFAQATANATPAILQSGTWLRIAELGPSAGTTTYLKNYPIIASRSYDGSGNPIGSPDQDNNIYFGQFPDRTFGNERALIVFDGATIRADLAGATILSASLWLYCFKAEETKGSFQGISESYSAVQATYNPVDVGYGVNDLWTVPSWNAIECYYTANTAFLSDILSGRNSVGLTPTSFGRAATGFRGYGFSADYRPFLQVVYSV